LSSCLEHRLEFEAKRQGAKVLAVIPAREHSRRVPRKNVRLLGGSIGKPEPLVCWTFKVAKQAESLDRIVVSTDDEKVKKLAEEYKIEVPFFPRPPELSEDVDSALVLEHCLKFLSDKDGFKPDFVCLLQPTSPFRFPEDINSCVRIARETGCDTVVSVRKVTEFPQWMFRPVTDFGELRLKPYLGTNLTGDALISQYLPKLWYPSGAVYITKAELVREGRIFGKDIRGYEMPYWRSLDIEEEEDFIIAEAILKWRKNQARFGS